MHTGILAAPIAANISTNLDPKNGSQNDEEELAELIGALAIPQPDRMSLGEYLAVDSQVPDFEPMSDVQIIAAVNGTPVPGSDSEPHHEEPTIDDIEAAPVPTSQAIAALQTVTSYFEQDSRTSTSDLDMLSFLMNKLLKMKNASAHQTSITSFFHA